MFVLYVIVKAKPYNCCALTIVWHYCHHVSTMPIIATINVQALFIVSAKLPNMYVHDIYNNIDDIMILL